MATKAELRNVRLDILNNVFIVSPNGNIACDRPRVPSSQLEAVRLAAADIYLTDKPHELSKVERDYWRNVRRPSERLS